MNIYYKIKISGFASQPPMFLVSCRESEEITSSLLASILPSSYRIRDTRENFGYKKEEISLPEYLLSSLEKFRTKEVEKDANSEAILLGNIIKSGIIIKKLRDQ